MSTTAPLVLTLDAPIPRLREGVAVHGSIAVVDDVQGMRVPQSSELLEAICLFDGESSARDIVRALAARKIRLAEEALAATAIDLDASFFLDTPRARARAARLANTPPAPPPKPSTQIVAEDLVFLPGSRFSCTGAGDCCSYYQIGPLVGPDIERLSEHDWTTIVPGLEKSSDVIVRPKDLDGKPHLRWVDQHCVFLDEKGMCRVHATKGPTVKPALCQLYPYTLVRRPDGSLDVSVRFQCQCIGESIVTGTPCEREAAAIAEIMRIRRQEPRTPPPLVRMTPGCCVPSATTFALDARVLEAVDMVGGGDRGLHAALRVVGEALERLGRLPDVERIDDVDRWLAGLDVRAFLGAPLRAYEPRAAVAAFGAVMLAIQDGVTKEYFWRMPLDRYERKQLEHRRDVAFAMHMLCSRFSDIFGAKLDMPSHHHEEVAAIDDGMSDPAVRAVATAFLRYSIYGKEWSYLPDLESGYGTMAMRYIVGRWIAKVRALDRGCKRVEPRDLTRGIVEIDRLGHGSWLKHVLQTIGPDLGAMVAMPFPFDCGLI